MTEYKPQELSLSYIIRSSMTEPHAWLRGSSKERQRIRLTAKYPGVTTARWLKKRLGYRFGLEELHFRRDLMNAMMRPNPLFERLSKNLTKKET